MPLRMTATHCVGREWSRRSSAGDQGGHAARAVLAARRASGRAPSGRAIQAAPAVYVPPARRRADAALAAWDPSAPPDSGASASTQGQQPWAYTATFQWKVHTDRYGELKIRGHVHYYTNGLGYTKAPGSTWVKGVENFWIRTPKEVVDNAPSNPVFAAFGEFADG